MKVVSVKQCPLIVACKLCIDYSRSSGPDFIFSTQLDGLRSGISFYSRIDIDLAATQLGISCVISCAGLNFLTKGYEHRKGLKAMVLFSLPVLDDGSLP